MIKFKKHIKVDEQVFETWLGMDIKKKGNKPNVSIFYYTDDPNNETSTFEMIKGNFASKDEAVRYAVRFMRNLYKDMLKRQQEAEN